MKPEEHRDMKRAKVLLADDHRMVAEGLGCLIRSSFSLVGIVRDGRELIDSVQKSSPDIVVSDLFMPLLNGLDAMREVKQRFPQVKTIILTMHPEGRLAKEAFQKGACGYLLKHSAAEELITAIKEVLKGNIYITPSIAREVITNALHPGSLPTAPTLTLRQREILQLIAEGKTMKEIAATLNVSTRTVEFHKYGIMSQLGLRSTAELVRHAIRIGVASI